MRTVSVVFTTILLIGLFFGPNNLSAHETVTTISNPSDTLVLVNKFNKLPTEYTPEKLVAPDVPFSDSEELLRPVAATALEEMFTEAESDDLYLYATSGYRSFEYQQQLHNHYIDVYGDEYAKKVSAEPGHSEHQTGLAIDVTASSVDFGLVQEFGDTQEGKWIKENADKFGYIIRYPNGKEHITGYTYEPWHLRYVGENTAKYIADNNLTMEEYMEAKKEAPEKKQVVKIEKGDTLWGIEVMMI